MQSRTHAPQVRFEGYYAMSTWTTNYCFDQFQKHKAVLQAVSGSNEDTTRMRAIDTILFDVLGWDKRDVETERYVRQEGYADYAIKDGDSLELIVEAKKAGETFMLPGGKFQIQPIGFALLAKECPIAEAALRQALGYAASEGARYIAITNGHQWVLALTFVQHQPFQQRSVFAFDSLEHIEKEFRLFWECFSPEGLRTNHPADALLESRKAPPPAKMSLRIPNYPVPANRNLIVNELSTIVGVVWDEMRHDEDDAAFMIECYVEPDTSASNIAQASELLSQRLSNDQQIFTQVVGQKDVPKFIETNLKPEKPIAVLGRVGQGKSTFLRYLRKVKVKDVLDKYYQIDIDFLDRPDEAAGTTSLIYLEIERQLEERYKIVLTDDSFIRGVLNADVNKFKKSTVGKLHPQGSREYKDQEAVFIEKQMMDKHVLLKKVFVHLRATRQVSIAVFLDNLDRRTEAIQEEAFLRGSAMARDWACLVFVCLRPSTFYHSRSLGVMDSVAPKVISVSSPRTDYLISRRLKYARKYCEGQATSTVRAKAVLRPEITFQLPTLSEFLHCMSESFRKNSKLAALFDAISNGNVRELLTYVYDTLTSGHLNTRKILDYIKASGKYILQDHEALRALLFGDSLHYDPSKSLFVNLFDLLKADPQEHFSRFFLLHHLCSVSAAEPFHGFTTVEQVSRYLCQLGFSQEHVMQTIQILFNKRLCESREPVESWSDSIKELRVTSRGKYHYANLPRFFEYMDAIVVDTPIIDDKVRQQIKDVMKIEDRLNRCELFLNYLNTCIKHIHDNAAQSVWHESAFAAAADIASIRENLAIK